MNLVPHSNFQTQRTRRQINWDILSIHCADDKGPFRIRMVTTMRRRLATGLFRIARSSKSLLLPNQLVSDLSCRSIKSHHSLLLSKSLYFLLLSKSGYYYSLVPLSNMFLTDDRFQYISGLTHHLNGLCLHLVNLNH
jgi:hypothetical protein